MNQPDWEPIEPTTETFNLREVDLIITALLSALDELNGDFAPDSAGGFVERVCSPLRAECTSIISKLRTFSGEVVLIDKGY